MRMGWRVGGRVCGLLVVVIGGLVWGVGGSEAQRGRREVREEPSARSRIASLEKPGIPRWEDLLADLRRLDRASERVAWVDLGSSTERRPLVALLISSPENLNRIDEIREAHGQLRGSEAGPAVGEAPGVDSVRSRAIVVVTAGGENGADLRESLRLVERLATSAAPDTARILDEVILVLVPSINPDGLDRLARTGEAEEGRAGERVGLHPYLGARLADDWDLLTQVETGLVVNRVLTAWHPQAWFDLRSSSEGSRLAGLDDGAAARYARAQGIRYQRLAIGTVEGDAGGPLWSALDQLARKRPPLAREPAADRAAASPWAYLLPEPPLPDSLRDAVTRLSAELETVSGNEEEQHEQSAALVNEVAQEPSSSSEVRYYYRTEGLDRILALLKRGGVEVFRTDQACTVDGRIYPAGTHLVPLRQRNGGYAELLLGGERSSRGVKVGRGWLPTLLQVEVTAVARPIEVSRRPEPPAMVLQGRVRSSGEVKVGLYSPDEPSLEEGWTRWVFDQYRFEYTRLATKEVRAGKLRTRYDVILLPSSELSPSGSGPGGAGLDREAWPALVDFVEAGGTLIAFDRASQGLIEPFQLPVRSTEPSPSPGSLSVVSVELDPGDSLAFGLGREAPVPWTGGPSFEVLDSTRARVVARYSTEVRASSARTGMPASPPAGQAALVEVSRGSGRVLLFGFSPLYRGVSLATFPFLFNAILTSGSTSRPPHPPPEN